MVISGSENNKKYEEATRRNTRVFPKNQRSSERHKTMYQDGQKRLSHTKQSIARDRKEYQKRCHQALKK
jgi:hypothetical protein